MERPSTADARTRRGAAASNTARAEPKEPLLRNIVLLGLIPRQPRSKTVAELRRELAARGFDVSARTLQRDLANKLAIEFPIFCDDTTPPYRWSFHRHAQFNLPAVDPAAALALYLSEGHLQRVLPPAVLDALAPQFAEARRQLSCTADALPFGAWARRVRAVPLGPVTKPAPVPLSVWEAIAEAVMKRLQLNVDYLSRSKGEVRAMRLHPQGLASRGAVTYLIASVDAYDDLRHFALHRIHSADVIAVSARDCGFDIDTYLLAAAFAPRHNSMPVQLCARVHPMLAWSLRELPLGDDQRLLPIAESEWETLEVSVIDDEETVRWIRSQGPDLHVVEPRRWQERLILEASNLLASTRELESKNRVHTRNATP